VSVSNLFGNRLTVFY